MNYNHSDIEASGFKFSGITLGDHETGFYRQREILKDLDLAYGSIAIFRTSPGQWEVFIRPDAKPGFADQPLFAA
jgi:hypothetical protein